MEKFGLFIAMADLGVSLGGVIMGPVADFTSYSFMYMICGVSFCTAAFYPRMLEPDFHLLPHPDQ